MFPRSIEGERSFSMQNHDEEKPAGEKLHKAPVLWFLLPLVLLVLYGMLTR